MQPSNLFRRRELSPIVFGARIAAVTPWGLVGGGAPFRGLRSREIGISLPRNGFAHPRLHAAAPSGLFGRPEHHRNGMLLRKEDGKRNECTLFADESYP